MGLPYSSRFGLPISIFLFIISAALIDCNQKGTWKDQETRGKEVSLNLGRNRLLAKMPNSCDANGCYQKTGISCCDSAFMCVTQQSKCFYCEKNLVCPGVTLSSGSCKDQVCQYGCCSSGNKCGTQEECTPKSEPFLPLWAYIAIGIGFILFCGLFILLLLLLRRRRIRQNLLNQANIGPAGFSRPQGVFSPPPRNF